MKETIKTIFLILLIFASLIQSYLLAYSTPKLEPIHQETYVPTAIMGTQESMTDLIQPSDMVLHMGDGKHTVLYPNTTFYQMIFTSLKQRTFNGFQAMDDSLSETNLDNIRSQDPGLEIRFKAAIPLQMLQNIFQIKADRADAQTKISKIWIYHINQEEGVQALFFENGRATYRATKPDLVSKDIDKLTGFGQFLPSYVYMKQGGYYLPAENLNFMQISMPYHQYAYEQLRRNLFVDPEMTKTLIERDGSVIYTDGKRGLQIKKSENWLSYSDPIAPVEGKSSLTENFLSAVKYVNEHGGWNGFYLIERIENQLKTLNQMYVFRQYIGQLPVYHIDGIFSSIQLKLKKSVVSGYQRSLIILGDQSQSIKQVSLTGGKDLQKMISDSPYSTEITNVFPAYRSDIQSTQVLFTPVWAARLSDGSVVFLK